jgi:hypothetical protein
MAPPTILSGRGGGAVLPNVTIRNVDEHEITQLHSVERRERLHYRKLLRLRDDERSRHDGGCAALIAAVREIIDEIGDAHKAHVAGSEEHLWDPCLFGTCVAAGVEDGDRRILDALCCHGTFRFSSHGTARVSSSADRTIIGDR